MTNFETLDVKASTVKPPRAAAQSHDDGIFPASEFITTYFSKTNNAFTEAANQIYQCQRSIMDHMATSFRGDAVARNGLPDYAKLTEQMHDQTECLLTNARKMQDTVRELGWTVTTLYAGAATDTAAHLKSLMPKLPV
ncbi:hypothetical protein [Acidocella sp.]|uniref:hypothetical protein n=1 Tax=Acidocella sp. TaxID=50710 RepID=UPI00261A9288|nr:hypothetical protein [Acidocella sp.]